MGTQGIIEAVDEESNQVCIDGEWFEVGEKVKIAWIKAGKEHEYNIKDNIVVFARCTEKSEPVKKPISPPPKRSPLTPKGEQAVSGSYDNRTQAIITACAIFHGTGKSEEFKKFVEEMHEYLQKGFWVNTEKVTK
jgi:hypothetical protein